jgi:hypothetical protein
LRFLSREGAGSVGGGADCGGADLPARANVSIRAFSAPFV